MRERFDSAGRSSEDVIRSLLELPTTIRIECVLAIGYPAEEKPPVAVERLLHESISEL
jgi:nitroreductase